jgi:hypothetical protein
MLVSLFISSFANIPPRFNEIVNRARTAAKIPQTPAHISFAAGHHGHNSIKFHLAYPIVSIACDEVIGAAWDGSTVAIIPNPSHRSFFRTPPVFVNVSEQRFFHLHYLEAETEDVLVFKTRELSFHEVFTEIKLGTSANGAPQTSDEPPYVFCSNASSDGRLAGNCSALVYYQLDSDEQFTLHQPIEGSESYTQLASMSRVDFSLSLELNSVSGFSLDAHFAVISFAQAAVHVEKGEHTWTNLKVPDLNATLPLDQAGVPTSITVAGIKIEFAIRAIAQARVDRLRANVPDDFDSSRVLTARASLDERISSFSPRYFSLNADRPEFSIDPNNSLPQWNDVDQTTAFEFSPVLRFGLEVDVTVGTVTFASQVGLEVGGNLTFVADKSKCNFPHLTGPSDFFIDAYHEFDPMQMVNSVLNDVFGNWHSVVKNLFDSASGNLGLFTEKLKSSWLHWVAARIIDPFVSAVDYINNNKNRKTRIWTSPANNGCLLSNNRSREGLPVFTDNSNVPVFINILNSYNGPQVLTNLALDYTGLARSNIGALTPEGNLASRVFITNNVTPESAWQYDIQLFSEGQTVSAHLPASGPVPVSSADQDLTNNSFSISGATIVGRTVSPSQEFTMDDSPLRQPIHFYGFEAKSTVPDAEYAFITNDGGYNVSTDYFVGIDTADVLGGGNWDPQLGGYRRGRPVNIQFDSVSQNLAADVISELTILRCPAGATQIGSDCEPLVVYRLSLPKQSQNYAGADLGVSDLLFDIDGSRTLAFNATHYYQDHIISGQMVIGSDPAWDSSTPVSITLTGNLGLVLHLRMSSAAIASGFVVAGRNGTRGIICRYFDVPQFDVSTRDISTTTFELGESEIYGVLRIPTAVSRSIVTDTVSVLLSLPDAVPLLNYHRVTSSVYIVYVSANQRYSTLEFLIPFRRASQAKVALTVQIFRLFTANPHTAVCSITDSISVLSGSDPAQTFPAGCLELLTGPHVSEWTPVLHIANESIPFRIVDLSLSTGTGWALHAWAVIGGTDRQTRGNQLSPANIDFDFPNASSILEISAITREFLLWGTDPAEIHVKCARCSELMVGGVGYHRQNDVFAIPVTDNLRSIYAICTNVEAANCVIMDGRFTGFVTKLARYGSDAGLIDLNFVASVTPLFTGVRQQIITANNLEVLLYDKTWEGSVEFIDLPDGPLVYEIEAITRNGQKGAYVRAYLGSLLVPFSPLQFLNATNQSFAKLGVTSPEQPGENEIVPNYLPDGDLVVNSNYFDYTLGARDSHDPITRLVDVPAALIQSFEFRCSERSQTIDGKCVAPAQPEPDSKGLSSEAVIGIAVGSVVVLVIIAALVIVVLRRRGNDGYRTAPT